MTLNLVRMPTPYADHLKPLAGFLNTQGSNQYVALGDADSVIRQTKTGGGIRLVVVDISQSGDAVGDIGRVRGAIAEGTPILVLGLVNDIHMFRSLVAVGASDYVLLPTSTEILGTAIDRLLAPADAQTAPQMAGQVVAVIGTRGGVGATTAALALGWILGEEKNKRTALLDLDLHFGTLALALDIDPGCGLRDALEKPERIDSLFIDRAVVRLGENLSILSAEESVEEDRSIDPAAAAVLLNELTRKLDWVVVDLPRGAGPLARTVLSAATHTIVIADDTLAGLRDAIRLQTLAVACNPRQRILVLKGGPLAAKGGVTQAEFEKQLGAPLAGVIPSDLKHAIAAMNAGQALPQIARNSPVANALRQIADRLAGAAEITPQRPKLFSLGRR